MGDMNIDLLKFNIHNKTNDVFETLFLFSFSPVITLPTRLSQNSSFFYKNKQQNKNNRKKSLNSAALK
jgi:hypothetical protein